MAFLIPDNLRSRKDVPEFLRRVASAFEIAFDDDVTVWFEPLYDLSNERPHFVLLDPRLGIVVLEMFTGGERAKLLGALRGKLRVEIDGIEREVDSPLERAGTFATSLRESVAHALPMQTVPITAVAVFSGIGRDQANRLGVDTLLDINECVFKEDLDAAIKEGNPANLLRVFFRAADQTLDRELDAAAIEVLRRVIHPDVVIAPSPATGTLFTTGMGDDVVRVMDRRQEALAKGLGSGHRVVRGVAGSGKTLVLVHRARLLAGLLPNKRILITCYTRSLASQLRAQLADFPNVDVQNLDKLMADTIKKAGLTNPGYNVEGDVAKVALEAAKSNGAPKYRAVLVDEAQDFDTDALEFCVQLLESNDIDQQDLIIVADSAQNIFRRNFRWKDAGIRAQGRTRLLRVNYRNTREILRFAHAFLTADPSITVDEAPDADDELSIIPAESSERSGPRPEVHMVNGSDEETTAVVGLVTRIDVRHAPARSIAVLVGGERGHGTERAKRIVDALERAGVPVFWTTDPDHKEHRDLLGDAAEPVVVSTVYSAKGLEFPKVIVCGLDPGADRTTSRKLFYVAFTRAVDELMVVVDQTSPFLPDARAAVTF